MPNSWGWNDYFEAQWGALGHDNSVLPARVVSEERGHYWIVPRDGETPLLAEVTGRFLYQAGSREHFPAVGDWVVCALLDGGTHAIILELVPRRSCLSRKTAGGRSDTQILASNVDVTLVASSMNQDFNVRRIERYLALVRSTETRPIVVLTKSDLAGDPDPYLKAARAVSAGAPVIAVSAATGQGTRELFEHLLPGETSVVLGSSGVGKSTLVNHWLGEPLLGTSGVRRHDDRGRHTTTRRQLLALPAGVFLIDTPGMRELQLMDHEEGLSEAFADVEALLGSCRFSNCSHGSEPGCRLREALEDGELEPGRWESYAKLQREIAFQNRKHDVAAALREKQKWKRIHAELKQRKKRPFNV